MINIADMPAVRAQLEQLERDVAEGKMQSKTGTAPVEYARAPAAPGQDTGSRPSATQGVGR
jgi:hypothetical protein